MTAAPSSEELFALVNRLETPLIRAKDAIGIIQTIANSLEDAERAAVLMAVCDLGMKECASATDVFEDLFKRTHPLRERLDREGWPA